MTSVRFSKKVALRYLWSRRSEAFITIISVISVIGVAIGVMVLNVVMSIMTGFESELKDKIVGANSHVVVRNIGGKIFGWHDALEKISSVEGVKSVSPFTYNQALLRVEGKATGILIRGIEKGSSAAAELEKSIQDKRGIEPLFVPPPVEVTTQDGTVESVVLPGLIIGRELERSYGLIEGTPISLLSPNVSSTPFGLVPKFKRFVVAGVYNSGLVEYESGLAYVALEEAQKFFRMGDTISGFEVRVKEVDLSPAIAKAIMEKLGGSGSGFIAQDWTETNKPLWDAIELEKRVYFIVLLLIVVMASFSIISTLVMIVLEKRKDIAILKTLGADSRGIKNIFRIQGAVIGGVGTIVGLVLAYAACKLLQTYGFPIDERVFQMSTLPVRIEPINFLIVGASAFLICCFATVYPAKRASDIDPCEALRY